MDTQNDMEKYHFQKRITFCDAFFVWYNIYMKNKIKFVSYSGEYPNLCSGKLVVKIDDKEVSFGFTTPSFFTEDELADYPRFWCSGGGVSFDEDWNESVDSYCDWEMSSPIEKEYPPEIWKLLPDILQVMNENVSGGCCGGCV